MPYTKEQINDAPGLAARCELARQDEARLYQHYGLAYSTAQSDSAWARPGAPVTTR